MVSQNANMTVLLGFILSIGCLNLYIVADDAFIQSTAYLAFFSCGISSVVGFFIVHTRLGEFLGVGKNG